MAFAYQETQDGNYEIVMLGGTLRGRVNYNKKAERRFALCTHKNDAEVTVAALNDAENNGALFD